jgi:tRNA(Ile)-lysidine synthase
MGSTPVRAAVAAALSQIGQGLYGVACSGGADSIALADAVIAVAGAPHVVVMTIDHGLQAGSAEVAARVASWARGQGAAPVVRRVEVPARASREAAARGARYAALEAIADEVGCCAVLLAHTARDQAETVLLRVVRGTGPAGLAGMARVRGRFVRPLLDVRRADIEAYCAARGLPVWDDPMNEDRAVARVRVRRELMPRLGEENPAIEDALVRLAAQAREWLEVIDARAAGWSWPIDCRALAREPAAVRKRVVAWRLEASGYEAAHLEAIDALVCAPRRGTVSLDVPGGHAMRVYDELDVRAEAANGSGERRAANGSGERQRRAASGSGERQRRAASGSGERQRRAASGSGERQPFAEAVRRSRPPKPLASAEAAPDPTPPGHILRTWQPGDRIRLPRLHGHSRKLSDLFTDLRIPRAARALARVVVRQSDGAITWAEHVGHAVPAPA